MKEEIKPGEFIKAVPIEKVDEPKQEAWGIFTAEVPDSDDEIADYAYQKGRVKAWSDDCKRKSETAGQELSLGNVRFSHTSLVTGKVIALNMDDAARRIGGGTYLMNVGDTKTWDMVAKGILQGFSFGGRYDWRRCDQCGRDLPLIQGENYCDGCNGRVQVRYGATIAELSVCDRPAVPVADIEHIKSDGSSVRLAAEVPMEKENKTKRVAGEDLTADCFAYVGDPETTSTWKFPIKFSSEEKTKRHIRNALARFDQAKGIPADEKPKVKAKILAAAKAHGIDVSEEEEKADSATLYKSFFKAELQHLRAAGELAMSDAGISLHKDLFDVSNFAEVLQRIAWLRYSAMQERDYEGDESDIPEELEENLISLSETFLSMAQEELAELVSAAKKAGKGITMEKELQISPETQEALTGHVVEMAAHHEHKAAVHKAAAEHHAAHAAKHKAFHEHFKAAAAEGGEHADHHAVHAEAHKAHHEHHLHMAEHHESMHKAHAEMADKCAKAAGMFADTPEKVAHVKELLKTASEAKPAVKKSAAPPPVDVASMSTTEKTAFDAVNAAWLNSDEYKKLTTDALRAQTVAKLNAVASSAAIAVGIEDGSQNIYAVPRSGQVDKNRAAADEAASDTELFSFLK